MSATLPLPARWGGARRLPLTRDQLMMLMVAVNLLFLGLDTYIAHIESGTIVPREWIPIIFGTAAGLLLLCAGLIAFRRRTLASLIATLTLLASVAVGLLGMYFHLVRAALPTAPAGQRLTLDLLVWAPPILGPLAFVMVGLLGMSAAWVEDPPGSGTLVIFRNWRLHLPYSKTRAYFFIVGMGMIAALVSSVLDHARTGFANPAVWIASVVGVFGLCAAVTMGAIEQPTRLDTLTYAVAMLLLIIAGPVGALFHIQANLVAGAEVVLERFVRGAPLLAPMLYANMGVIGLLVLLQTPEQPANQGDHPPA
jgi:hypothetical protein